ncbi:hypothetical protein PsYK624_125470 [Phanerochaete sordida]|uniref:DUF6533 domain-containing protein n=1 Tax=Phanerochaete sordida TaxID=48140 RepID=A0A9P3GIU4_9APHY|nr:hypothetical protein PsYK624_125470 [Phanerochaete sordida]
MATPPAELQDIRDAVTDYYIACSLFALMVYEYITTFDQEVAVVWGRKFSATSVLLLGSRWLMVVFAYLVFYPGPANCRDEFTALGAIFITVLIVVPLFSALRVYAIWKASSWSYVFFFSTLLLGLAPVGANVFGWVRTEISYVDVPVLQSQCVYSINVSQTHRQDAVHHPRLGNHLRPVSPGAYLGQDVRPFQRDAAAQHRLLRLLHSY